MKKGALFIGLFILALAAGQAGRIYAQSADLSQAKVVEMNGSAQFEKAGTSAWLPLDKNTLLSEGDTVKTAHGSQVRLELVGNAKTAEIVVRENSEFLFKTFRHDEGAKLDNTLLDVEVGSVLVKAEKLVGNSKFEVKTPTSIVGIRGTIFEVNVTQA
ncbi:MAG: FecR domain-containing protein [Candidatus Omnitrophica bacterium]|nr:FecR domain-containing protein [Candidatus Omnitrophota bacterium]